MYKIELHAHSFSSSCDSHLLPTTLVQEAYERGYHGIVISNHFEVPEIAKMYRNDYHMCHDACATCSQGIRGMRYDTKDYKELYRSWFLDVMRAQRRGEQLGIKVYAGCEYSTKEIDAHIGILGLTLDEFMEAEFMPEEDIYYLQLFREKYPDMLLIQNHPNRSKVIYIPPFVDAYERFNTKHINYMGCDSAPEMVGAVDRETFQRFLFVCGGDVHNVDDLGISYMDFDKLPEDEHELAREIRERNYTIHIEV